MTSSPRPSRSRPHTLVDLVCAAPGIELIPGPDDSADPIGITGVSLDSRRIEPGDLYAALPGANVHGARFAAQAIEAGALAVLTDPDGTALLAPEVASRVPILVAPDPRSILGAVSAQIYGHPSRELTMFGVTGTNGKTTTVYLLEAALRALGRSTGLIGTIETRIAEQRLPSVRTTPESCDLHALLGSMRERGVEACCMEVSSHALSLHRVDGVRYDVAVFTNLSQDHLDFHGSMPAYFEAKASLFTPARSRRAVVCVDDDWGRRLAAQSRIPVLTLTSRPGLVEADWCIEADDDPQYVTVSGPQTRVRVRSALPGAHNRINTALALLALVATGVPAAEAAAAFEAGTSVPGRMQFVELPGQAPQVYVDFAHTPDAITATLTALRDRNCGPLVAVVGAGGDRDPGKRGNMGAAAAVLADHVVVTDDNPRHEDPAAIRSAVVTGAREAGGARVHDVADRSEAISQALALATPCGTLAVLGKGHEQGQTVLDCTTWFDDAEVVIRQWARTGPDTAKHEEAGA